MPCANYRVSPLAPSSPCCHRCALARQIGTLLIASSVTGLWLRLEQLAGLNDFAVDVLDQHIASKVSGKLATMSIEDGKERDVRVVVDVLLDNESVRGSMSK